jgi:hypothetical protein
VTALSPPSLQVRSHGARAMGLIGRGGPAPRRRAWSLEAGLLPLRLRAAHARTRPHAGKWGGGGSPSLPPLCRAMRACFAGGRPHADGRRRRASPSRAPRSACACMRLRTRERAQAGLAAGLACGWVVSTRTCRTRRAGAGATDSVRGGWAGVPQAAASAAAAPSSAARAAGFWVLAPSCAGAGALRSR